MQMVHRIRGLGLLVVLTLALASAALGFAHHAPSADAEMLRRLELAGFPSGPVCGTPAEATQDDCPVCHLTGAVPVPAGTGMMRDAALGMQPPAPQGPPVWRTVRDPARGVRGPPQARQTA